MKNIIDRVGTGIPPDSTPNRVLIFGVNLWLAFIVVTAVGAPLTDPGAFVSSGDFNPNANVVINMSSGQMTGGAAFSAQSFTEAGFNLYVFSFDSFTLAPNRIISFVNTAGSDYGVAFLSRGDMTIEGSINGSASLQTPGPGGGSGGFGPGNGQGGGDLTGGGGFGGRGGSGYGGGSGGTYGDLSAALASGSSGGGNSIVAGGGGGGAIQLGTWGTLSISGSVLAKGGNGVTNFNQPRASGGGSGGGILLYGMNVTVSGVVDAGGGGAGGNATTYGGGGGGGRVYVATSTNGTFSNTGSVGATGATVLLNGVLSTSASGRNGVVSVVQSDQVVVPEPSVVAALSIGALMLLHRSRRRR